jgi:taurine dioxygenase
MMTSPSAWQVTPSSGSIGSEVSGVELRKPLEPEAIAAIRRLLVERLVLFFPGQFLTPDEQRAFMRQLGPVQKHPERPRVLEGSEEEVVVVIPQDGVSAVWHCDYDPDFVPCGICTLNIELCAADGGGDTIFVNNDKIYDAFSPAMQQLLDGLTAIHRNTGNSGRVRDEARFPLVGIHPDSGRKTLLYSAHHVQDFAELMPEETELVLARLRALTQLPKFACRHHWRPGTLALWDNRRVQHYAVPDFSGPRRLYQVTIEAPLPIAVDAASQAGPGIAARPLPDVSPRPLT